MSMDTGGGVKADINITPLVDIVLVLLIIFMVITPLMTKMLPVLVPEKAEVEQPTEQMKKQVVVYLRGDNTIEVNHEVVAMKDLEERLRLALKIQSEKIVFFEADDEAAYGNAVLIMDAIKGSGTKIIGIMTPDEDEG
jgi:biopolymer transport protein ExbD